MTLTPSDAELVDMAYERISALEEPLYKIRDLAIAITAMAAEVHSPLSGAVGTVGQLIVDTAEEVEEVRGEIFHALHPRRHEPGFGDGEAEEATGDVAGGNSLET